MPKEYRSMILGRNPAGRRMRFNISCEHSSGTNFSLAHFDDWPSAVAYSIGASVSQKVISSKDPPLLISVADDTRVELTLKIAGPP